MNAAIVTLWGKEVGAIAWDDAQQLASFEYYPDFVNTGQKVSPLLMPLRAGRIYSFPMLRKRNPNDPDAFKGLPGLVADSLPDDYGNALMDVWLASQGRATGSMNPVEQLCFIGARGMGALEFTPALLPATTNSYNVEVGSLVDLAKEILDKRSSFTADLSKDKEKAIKDILRISTSAGGARPKAIIAYNEKTKEVRSGQARAPQGFEHWLLKLDGVSDTQFGESQGYGRVEMAYYNMAVDAGITMMPSMLLEENGRAHFMTKRFDRSGSNTKHHVQTFCAMQHYDFNLVGNNSYEQLFQTARQLNLSAFEQTELFRRMVFNVIMKNCDDHTKNFSFILKETESWALSPAYDVCHAYRPDSVWVSKHALSINGKREGITRHDLLAVAENVGVKKPERIIDLINDVARQWLTYAKSARVFEEKAIAIKKDIKPL